jgi:ferritin-like metal-binding protein YciE
MASSILLRRAIASHLKETQQHVERLGRVAEILGMTLTLSRSKAIEDLIGEGSAVLALEGDAPVVDAALAAAVQWVEHFEISAYGSARALADRLGNAEVAELLQMTLDEEYAADARLTMISLERILPSAADALGLARNMNYPLGAA